jgi:hypothetical protein
MDGWHVTKIYKHIMNTTKNQPSLAHVNNVIKSQFYLTLLG